MSHTAKMIHITLLISLIASPSFSSYLWQKLNLLDCTGRSGASSFMLVQAFYVAYSDYDSMLMFGIVLIILV